jgi:16S rRNA G966 N2-methylase RsmD
MQLSKGKALAVDDPHGREARTVTRLPSMLYHGDNLPILRDRGHFPSESIDLVYLDPPFD